MRTLPARCSLPQAWRRHRVRGVEDPGLSCEEGGELHDYRVRTTGGISPPPYLEKPLKYRCEMASFKAIFKLENCWKCGGTIFGWNLSTPEARGSKYHTFFYLTKKIVTGTSISTTSLRNKSETQLTLYCVQFRSHKHYSFMDQHHQI